MISESVIANSESWKRSFNEATPFPHVCIDDFLKSDFAEALLLDFPRFNKELALNEFGQFTPKHVVQNIGNISASYRKLYDLILSREFLNQISSITGISDLEPDPLMFGGGTHENINGAELDPHIDFNYDSKTNNHRRLNILIYLNKEWSTEWGGAIELHENPLDWFNGRNKFKAYNCEFNRCVIFETSESSWHGFRKIHLPAGKEHLSRRLISIYLYTKDRPSCETVAPHGTFYLPYAPKRLALDSDRPITKDEFGEIKRLMIKRDMLLSAAYRKERKIGSQLESLKQRVAYLENNLEPKLLGYCNVVPGKTSGYYYDKWVAEIFSIVLRPIRPASRITLSGWVPEESTCEIEITVADKFTSKGVFSGAFSITLEADGSLPEEFNVKSTSTITRTSSPNDLSRDLRRRDVRSLTYLLSDLDLHN